MTTRTNPELWEQVKKRITAGTKGGDKGEWSARKAQLAVKEYKDSGGGYVGKKSKKNALVKWTEQNWTTKSGKDSSKTGERYLPQQVIEGLTHLQYQATTKAKRKGTKEGKQYVPQPKNVKLAIQKIMSKI